MALRLLTELILEFPSLKGGTAGLSDSTLVKMPHCWKSHIMAHIVFTLFLTKYLFKSTKVLVRTIPNISDVLVKFSIQ